MKKGLKILLFTDIWATLALGMIGPIYAIFVEKIGGDILDASWAYFSFMVTSGVAVYLIGHWEDKIRHQEKLITGGYILTALGCLSYIFVFNQLSLIITQVILGLAGAILAPAYDALYSDYLDEHKKASGWGDWEAMKYVVAALAALLGGYIASVFGFRALFIVMFIISLLSVFSSISLYGKKKYLKQS